MEPAMLLVGFGLLFLAGLALDWAGHIVHVPRVTLLILLGVVLGPAVLDILPPAITDSYGFLAPTALTMIAFLLGGTLQGDTLRAHGREIIVISLTVVILSAVIVATGLFVLGAPFALALVLGGLSCATDPAATRDVVEQSGRKDAFTTNLLGIVAIDDAWGLLIFSFLLTFAAVALGGETTTALTQGLWEAGGAIGLGLVLGFPSAYLTGRIRPGEPTLTEALGVVFLCAGLALWLEVSFLLAGMVTGAIVVNFARHHDRPLHEIKRVEWPFMLLFFVMAGASLEIGPLKWVGMIGVFYVALRIVARLIGGWAGARLAGLSGHEGRLTGLSLMPQAGVAIGMALVAAERFPVYGEQILALAIASTIVFEVIGPFMTQVALARSNEDRSGDGSDRNSNL